MAFLMFGVPFALLASRGGRLADKHGALRIALLSTACVAPLTAFYGWITVPILFVSLGLVEGILQAMGIPAASAIIAIGAPDGRAGGAQGLAGAGSMLLGATTAYMAGPIYKHLGPRWVFGIAGAGVWLLSLLAISQRDRRPAAVAVS
jgi:MFS family permease